MLSNGRELVRPRTTQTNRGQLRNYKCLRMCAVVVALAIVAGPALARTQYDGTWSVLIVTRGGACDAALRYPVAIVNGRVANAGDTPVAVQGRVASSGAVSVTLQAAGQWASGSGRLNKTSGSGMWRGQGTRGFCQGTWQAQRRSYGAETMESSVPRYYNYSAQPRTVRSPPIYGR